jgi:hypothetical protein
MTSTLCLEIADAARLLANADFERFLGRRRLGAWLWEIVGEADDLAFGCFCNRVEARWPLGSLGGIFSSLMLVPIITGLW